MKTLHCMKNNVEWAPMTSRHIAVGGQISVHVYCVSGTTCVHASIRFNTRSVSWDNQQDEAPPAVLSLCNVYQCQRDRCRVAKIVGTVPRETEQQGVLGLQPSPRWHKQEVSNAGWKVRWVDCQLALVPKIATCTVIPCTRLAETEMLDIKVN